MVPIGNRAGMLRRAARLAFAVTEGRRAGFGSVLLGAALLALPVSMPAGSAQPAQRGFEQWDVNHDRRISWDEGWQSIQHLFALADANHDGALTMDEWLAARLPARPAPNRQPVDPKHQQDRRAAMFRALDADRDARVTLAEVQPVAEAWFRAFDANADGALTPEELPWQRLSGPQAR